MQTVYISLIKSLRLIQFTIPKDKKKLPIFSASKKHADCETWLNLFILIIIHQSVGPASVFLCIFITKLPAKPWWAQKPRFFPERKEAQLQRSVQGAAAPLLPPSLSPQARAAEPESNWVCASGCVILCSRVMSPWFTITAHSVLLFFYRP